MSGVISDIELQAFEAEEMNRHYREGFCGGMDCPFCLILKIEREYWEDFEQEEFNRICEEDLDEEDYV